FPARRAGKARNTRMRSVREAKSPKVAPHPRPLSPRTGGGEQIWRRLPSPPAPLPTRERGARMPASASFCHSERSQGSGFLVALSVAKGLLRFFALLRMTNQRTRGCLAPFSLPGRRVGDEGASLRIDRSLPLFLGVAQAVPARAGIDSLCSGLGRGALLLLLLLLALPGCQRAGAERPGVVELTIWTGWTGTEEIGFQRVLRRYEQLHPNIRFHSLGGVNDDTKTVRAIVAGVPPDVFAIRDVSYLGPYAHNRAIRPLDDLFRQSGL